MIFQALETNGWLAEFVPECGANLCRLKHLDSDYDILRHPPDPETFLNQPECWGFPVLFPPNRISNGMFSFQDRTYMFPINEPVRGNHIHGILLRAKWTLRRKTPEQLLFEFRRRADSCWRHDMTVTLQYDFQRDLLRQTFCFRNDSSTPMPFLFGLHSAFRITDDTKIRIATDGTSFRLRDDTKLPTGETIRNPAWLTERRLAPGEKISELLRKTDDTSFRGMRLDIPSRQLRIDYLPEKQFRFWMLWNGTGNDHFFCAEPQTCLVDAPNLNLPHETTGFRVLEPGGHLSLLSELRVSYGPADKKTAEN